MIFAHALIGIILGKLSGNYFWFIIGSILPDADHLYIIAKNKIFGITKIIESIKFEKKYGIKYKTPLFHSIIGIILFSTAVYIISKNNAIPFTIAYFLHLLLDWLDIDEKQYLYPLKTRFKGYLQIWSKPEQAFTIILLITLATLYLF